MSIRSKQKILISECLLGKRVRYDGNVKHYDISLLDNYELISCCPEVNGGLSIPRDPSEIQPDGKVINSKGFDVSDAFAKGANLALELAISHDIKVAILKSYSPSCSSKMIYDGTFNGRLIRGIGITTKVLEQNGIKVFDESQIKDAIASFI